MANQRPDEDGDRLDLWHAGTRERALDPSQPIIDPHHHLWDRRRADDYREAPPTHARYLGDELMADIVGSGHRVLDTVFVECLSMYRAGGGAHASVGEVEFVQGVAAMAAADLYGGDLRCCGGIIGYTDLTRGVVAGEALDSLAAAGAGFRGVRQAHGFHPSPDVPSNHHPTRKLEHLLGREDFRAGFSELAARGLLFECWGYHEQLPEVAELARAFPETTIVLDHIGGPLAIGPYAEDRKRALDQWRRGIETVAACSNVVVKLGGCGMPIYGFGFEDQNRPSPSSEELADAWAPWLRFALEAFGPGRSMFESNFPVDKVSCSYGNLWNAFKRIAALANLDPSARDDVFWRTAARTYSLTAPTARATPPS
jgi:L-fuconolactonase